MMNSARMVHRSRYQLLAIGLCLEEAPRKVNHLKRTKIKNYDYFSASYHMRYYNTAIRLAALNRSP